MGPSGEKNLFYSARASQRQTAITRRNFLKGAAAFAVALGAYPVIGRARSDSAKPRIAIVGAGLAGLSAAYYLRLAGYTSTLYEASNRIGGRVITVHGKIANNLNTELGGEFIDSDHQTMHELAQAFGLTLSSVKDPMLVEHDYFIGGEHYSEKEVAETFRLIAPRIAADFASLPKDLSYSNPGSAQALDQLSLAEYFDRLGIVGWFSQALHSAYTTEYGLDCGDQSALNFVELVKTDTSQGHFDIFGESDECCRIDGGNDRLTEVMAASLNTQIETGMRLVSISKPGTAYTLNFEHSASGLTTVQADIVIMTIPFSVLRSIELHVPLPAPKERAINELGYGTNAKLITGFSSAPWRAVGSSGYTFTDEAYLTGWESAHDPKTGSSAYAMLLGGREGVESNSTTPITLADRLLPGLDRAYPGTLKDFTRKTERFHWPSNPYSLGCYACYKPGQWTSIAGAEAEPVELLYFAGEHCGGDAQGFMEGAALSGKRAAQAIAQRFGK